jgi:hypothetical protein
MMQQGLPFKVGFDFVGFQTYDTYKSHLILFKSYPLSIFAPSDKFFRKIIKTLDKTDNVFE